MLTHAVRGREFWEHVTQHSTKIVVPLMAPWQVDILVKGQLRNKGVTKMMPLYDKMGPLFRKLEPTNPLFLRQPYLYPSLHDFY